MIYGFFFIKCRSDDAFRNKRVKRGKPRKQETQILVGEPNRREKRISYGIDYSIDRCLSPFLRNRIWLIKYYFVVMGRNYHERDWSKIERGP